MNEEYPAHGRWQFTVNKMVGNDDEAVSDVSVTDGVSDGAGDLFLHDSRWEIVKMIEFWPDNYEAPANRKHLGGTNCLNLGSAAAANT